MWKSAVIACRKARDRSDGHMAAHHDPRFYPDPEEFRPNAGQKNSPKGLDKFAYIPFGVGAHRCIGALFAEAEAMLAIASILQLFQIRAVSNEGVTPIVATSCALENEV